MNDPPGRDSPVLSAEDKHLSLILALSQLMADRHLRGTARFDTSLRGQINLRSALARKVNLTRRWGPLRAVPFETLLSQVQTIVQSTIEARYAHAEKGVQS